MSKTMGVCEKCNCEALHRLDRDEGFICENCDRELEQWEYDYCVACNRGAWVNHEGKCSDCDGSHTENP